MVITRFLFGYTSEMENNMIFKKIRNKKHIHRVLLTLLLPIFTLTSTFVYAQDSEMIRNKDVEQEHFLAPLIIPVAEESNIFIDTFEDINISSNIPIVQSPTFIPSLTASLYQGSEYDYFFEHSVFVGDSLTVGFQTFCSSSTDSIASENTYFLARESGSAQAAISEKALTTFANIMPKYQNKVQLIEDSISQMTDVNKVFICFGMNDLVSTKPEKFVQNLETLINRILEKRSDVSIYILSIPCIVNGVQTGSLSNTSIQNANQLLATTCTERQWGFINTAEYLMDNSLSIRSEYSSDGYVHENNSAYRIWTSVLRNYAYESLH